jgi:hypothetical protein
MHFFSLAGIAYAAARDLRLSIICETRLNIIISSAAALFWAVIPSFVSVIPAVSFTAIKSTLSTFRFGGVLSMFYNPLSAAK